MRKLFSLFLALTLTAQLIVPAWAETTEQNRQPEETVADLTQYTEGDYSASAEGNICGHEHTVECYQLVTECIHTHGDCGYVPAVEGHDCDCQPDESGVVVHMDGCGFVEAVAEVPCDHVCSEENGCIRKVLNCQHQHDDTCGYAEKETIEPEECETDPIEEPDAEMFSFDAELMSSTDSMTCEKVTAKVLQYKSIIEQWCSQNDTTKAYWNKHIRTGSSTCSIDGKTFYSDATAYIKSRLSAGDYTSYLTTTPCPGGSHSHPKGTCYSNEFGRAWTCNGFANYMNYIVFGLTKKLSNGSVTSGFESFNFVPGDIAIYSKVGSIDIHFRYIYDVDDTYVYYVAGNDDSQCGIRFGKLTIAEARKGYTTTAFRPLSEVYKSAAVDEASVRGASGSGSGESITPTLSISNWRDVTDLKPGSNFGLRGTISTDYGVITSVTGEILNSGGSVVLTHMDRPNTSTYNIRTGINNHLAFEKLSNGRYTIKVRATANNNGKTNTQELVNQSFNVGSVHSCVLTKTEAVAPTYFAPGNNEYYTCVTCGKVFKDAAGTMETTVDAETLAQLPSVAYGECGDNVNWVLTSDGTLTISGSGAMSNFFIYQNVAPWLKNWDKIARVVVEPGVTSIGDYTFLGCAGLTNVTIPDGVTYIGYQAFGDCKSLASVTIPGSVRNIGGFAFQNCTGLTSMTILEGTTSIGENAFYGCTGLTSVTIPGSVVSIGDSAFCSCSGLTSVTIHKGVTSIGWGAFSGCSGLTSITIPESVTSIKAYAFMENALKRIEVATGNANYCAVDGVLYDKNMKNLLVYPAGSTENSFNIPESVSHIDDAAFFDCTSLNRITIPESVTSIGSYAFSGCSGLSEVHLSNSVSSIGEKAFDGCNNLADVFYSGTEQQWNSIQISENNTCLTNARLHFNSAEVISGSCGKNLTWAITENGVLKISGTGEMQDYEWCEDGETVYSSAPWGRMGITGLKLGEGITRIGACAFLDCSDISGALILPRSLKEIGGCAFSGCYGISGTLNFPENLEKIEDCAFQSCDGLYGTLQLPEKLSYIGLATFNGCSGFTGQLDIPKNVQEIGDWAFLNCSGLTNVSIPGRVATIGSASFGDCSSLTSITIPEGVTSIGNSAFRGCSSLISVRIPESVTSIGNEAFRGCSSLTSITIPEGVTSIGYQTFDGCSGLTSVSIPESVTSIGWGAFSGCSSLTSITIPDGMTSIESGTFSGCSSLTSITIPEGVTSIEGSAFDGCSSLTGITLPESVTSIGNRTFFGCSSLTSITIPESVTSIEDATFSHCSSLSSITLPAGVTSIEYATFSFCSSLTSVRIPEGVASVGEWAFFNCIELKDIYYGGAKTDWKQIQIAKCNTPLLNATIHYQIQSAPEIRPVDTSTLDGGATLKLTLWSIDQDKQIGAAWSLAEGSEAYASITASGTLTAKAVIEPVEITVIAQPTNGEPTATKTIRITPKATALLLMRDEEVLGETLNADMYDLQALTLTAIKNTMEEAQGIHWSTSAKTVAQVDAKGLVTLLKPGRAVIQATDSGKLTGKVTLNVTYTDKSPRLEATTLNLNTALSGGVTVDFVEAYGNGVEALQWNDARFLFEYQENRLTVSAKDALKNGTYPVSLTAACSDGRTYEYPLTLKVTNTLPKVTVKQTAKLNLFYRDSRAPLVISAPGQSMENAELTDTGDFALENTEDGWEIVCTTDSPKPDTKGTLNLYLEGYREPVKAALNIGTVSTAPRAKLSATSSTVNSGSDLTTQVKLLDNSGKPLELEDPTVVCENASVSVDGNLLTITLDEAKSTTVTLYLQDSTWARSMKLTHKITVSNKTPTLKPAGSLTLSSLFTARTAETAMVLSQSNLTLVDVEAAPTAKAGTSALAESEKLRVAYDPDTGHMVAAIRDSGNAPKAGTYSFTCTGTLEDGKDIPGGTLRVTVSAAAPKIKLSATSVKLNQYLAGEEQGRVRVTAPSGYQVADFTGKPEGMSFDGDTGMLTVTLEDASHKGGTYTLYPLVRDMENGEEVPLPTKLRFQVRAYNSKKLSVSLSAKGKLDTQTDGEIAYTVTKLTNCLGTVENVDLVGQDGDLFQADMDLVKGKPTVHLTLVSGSTYATNKAYKIQLRFYACGKEILSPVQTVKVTQTALKVTAPKTVTYYQAQKAPLRVVLTTNLPMDTVALNSKTAKEFQSALGEVTLNGNRVEFEIANPAALTAGKSYALVLDAIPENNAKNIKPVTVKLTVKVRK